MQAPAFFKLDFNILAVAMNCVFNNLSAYLNIFGILKIYKFFIFHLYKKI